MSGPSEALDVSWIHHDVGGLVSATLRLRGRRARYRALGLAGAATNEAGTFAADLEEDHADRLRSSITAVLDGTSARGAVRGMETVRVSRADKPARFVELALGGPDGSAADAQVFADATAAVARCREHPSALARLTAGLIDPPGATDRALELALTSAGDDDVHVLLRPSTIAVRVPGSGADLWHADDGPFMGLRSDDRSQLDGVYTPALIRAGTGARMLFLGVGAGLDVPDGATVVMEGFLHAPLDDGVEDTFPGDPFLLIAPLV